ncbi:hypothetical protein [Rhizobium sp. SYY.PMSO]|uniref:hypothetical protein n=1 Tax=Rhizobium sp. SYY.PMSO TaxID=3382192 RepID=UPI00398F96FC
MRHRVSLQDLAVLLVVMLMMIYVAFEVDIFRSEGQVMPVEETIELDESLLLGGLLTFGLLVFRSAGFRRRSEKRRLGNVSLKRHVALVIERPLICVASHAHFDYIGCRHEFPQRCVHCIKAPILADPRNEWTLAGRYATDTGSKLRRRSTFSVRATP